MQTKRTSYAFLMEMLWVSGFFLLSACIFVLAFVKADRISLDAENLNEAVTATQNVLEDAFADYDAAASVNGSQTIYFDSDWNRLKLSGGETPDAKFHITITASFEEQLLKVTAAAFSDSNIPVYTLNGAHYIPKS